MNIFDTKLVTLDGEDTTLARWQGEVLLVVNVASKCGLTPQYQQLEELHRSLNNQGFSVLGFPCNAFLGQEPGTAEEIKTFCSTTYGVTFPMFTKTEVNGPHRHPLYQQLVAAQPVATAPLASGFLARMESKGRAPKEYGDILWNFEKFLIGRDGRVLARFSPDMKPEDPLLTNALNKALTQ
ncbi:glutathione peroxidase [Erwinia tracheiphila]|uniref:Thioredoxin/glutathione peroxidase BtuE n=1 Tax=Erwinia tracheiphila TaxID=65700 RepID=A0A0M2KBY5_9GAMM|nr:glutathione peroxidase [Erwinia tracheiphila]AXF75980.1 glutathione peroxidase [Erwinia tracheiphila]EOS96776.1 glutathione peroxidase [Erwinia tracheiphila PSU-1]KKF34763.1 glutathione peroxidase [Erwinia tracheiphila]UIA85356.1 glutathione peroxidase [Erwinia tracheiphila]UIA86444.1 glutathione peroxidase [Erwinia tracheiphila]